MIKSILILLYITAIYAVEIDTVSIKSMYHHDTIGPLYKLQLSQQSTPYTLKSLPGLTYLPSNRQQLIQLAKSNKLLRWSSQQQTAQLTPKAYMLPDVTDHATVLSLAEMSYNAYTELGKEGTWYDLGTEWRIVSILFFF